MENKRIETEKANNDTIYSKVKFTGILLSWPFVAIIALVLYLITKDDIWPFNFVLGSATCLLGFTLMVNAANKTKPEYLKKTMVTNFLIRYLIYGIVLTVCFLKDDLIGVYPCAIGLVVPKIIIIICAVYSSRRHDSIGI